MPLDTELLQASALSEPVDVLLADVAVRIQLTRTDYKKADDRYHTINSWIERPGSPLEDRVTQFYPQGSMAIGSTIASKLRTDEFDIDIVAELDLPTDTDPQLVLDLLYQSIRGDQGSKYHGMARRRTRCVTVDYADDMHLDVTPVVRRNGRPERESLIFHHSADDPNEPKKRLIANPYGFSIWFKDTTPADAGFAEAFAERSMSRDRLLLAEAVVDDVPEQEPIYLKSKAVVVLQLLKRWRNVRYDKHTGRKPPSVMMAKLVAEAANHADTLSHELLLQAKHILAVVEDGQRRGILIRVTNPICEPDVFTDRWPSSFVQQDLFIANLHDLVAKVERLVAGSSLPEMQAIMTDLFGEFPTGDVFSKFVERSGRAVEHGESHHRPGSGRFDLSASGVVSAVAATPATVRATPRHTFYGTDHEKYR